ncbi:MAG: glycerol-3-phosphate acyltransferase [Alphaproteobacteria bacterium]|nr:glycerol-3-phosphate acyltransferase [Alphaproteobacteria bacterium]
MIDPLGDVRFLWPYVVVFVASFLVGSIPFGLVLTRLAGLGDIRRIGSGNIGATNVLRTGRKGLAALTLLLDAAKGAAPVLVAETFMSRDPAILAAAGAFLGHLMPVWLIGSARQGKAAAAVQLLIVLGGLVLMLLTKGVLSLAGPLIAVAAAWRAWGGKGVATGLGVLLALSPTLGLIACLCWLAIAGISRYSSLAALAAFVLSPIAAYGLAHHPIGGAYMSDPQLTEFTVFLAVLILFRHRDNIERLLRGEESRIGAKTPAPNHGEPP